MGDCDRQWHEFRCIGARIAEHKALVACAELLTVGVGRLLHTHPNVGALLTNRHRYPARVGIEADRRRCVADVAHDGANGRRNVNVSGRRHLTGNVYKARCHHRLDGHARHLVKAKHLVKDRIRNLVADLVGMTFGDRLGRKQAQRHVFQHSGAY